MKIGDSFPDVTGLLNVGVDIEVVTSSTALMEAAFGEHNQDYVKIIEKLIKNNEIPLIDKSGNEAVINAERAIRKAAYPKAPKI